MLLVNNITLSYPDSVGITLIGGDAGLYIKECSNCSCVFVRDGCVHLL